MALYDVRHMTEEIVRLTELSVKCCERVKDAVYLLDNIADAKTAEAGAQDLRGNRPARNPMPTA